MVLEADLRKRKEIKVKDIVKDKSIKICGFLKIKSGRKGSKELRFLAEIGAQGDVRNLIYGSQGHEIKIHSG